MNTSQLDYLINKLDSILLGNPQATRLAICCILARGHLLIEDIPGVGKTTLSQALATLLGLPFKRVQFTSDLLPTDIIGVTVYDLDTKKFQFRRGPVFTSILLADEINRASPKTQSALLQAMEERQISVEGTQIDLPEPFFVIATQNPLEQSGTFPLPESQLDRFLMRISLGYPGESHEKLLLKQQVEKVTDQTALLTPEQLLELSQTVSKVHVSDALINYLYAIIEATRRKNMFINGLSPRAGLQWLEAAQAWAFLHQRDNVLPDDIKFLAPYTAAHRLQTKDGQDRAQALSKLIDSITVL